MPRTVILSHRVILCTLLLVAGACSNPFSGGDCVALGVTGITATVTDGATNAAPSSSPELQLIEGSYEERGALIVGSRPPVLIAAIERPGTYRVVVRAAGYRDYVKENTVVRRGGKCNAIQPVQLDVQLVPSGSL